MHVFRKLFAASAAAIVAMASGVLVAHADSAPSVYTTPGGQISQGRLWNTTCEKYSPTIVRCRAEIWATTVTYVNGRYVKRTGWTFNNLSYLPSPRASWANNNLGRTNPNWTQSGRQWRTECDTPATGKGGCRSYIWIKTVQPASSGSGYQNKYAWVFNNVVLFSSSSVPPVTSVPPWIIDQSRLSPTGLGPLQVGASSKDLEKLGYLVEGVCDAGDGTADRTVNSYLFARGIAVVQNKQVYAVQAEKPGVKTVDGAHVGMTLAQVKAIYGSRLRFETKYGYKKEFPMSTAVIQEAGNEIVFSFDANDRPLKDTDVMTYMVAREIDSLLGLYMYDC